MNTEQLISSLAQGAGTTKPAPCPLTFSKRWLLATLAYVAVMPQFLGLRPDLAERLHAPLFTAEILALFAMIVTSSLAACVLAFPDLCQMKKWLFAPVISLLLFLGIIAAEWFQSALASIPPAPPLHEMDCLLCILSLSFIPAALLLYLMRGYASTRRKFAGSMAMLSAFSIGALTLRLCEETDSMPHLIQWHYLPMLGVCAVGLLLGKIILKW